MATDKLHLVTFRRGDCEFGLEVACVRRVLSTPEIRAIAGSPAFVPGRIRFEGRSQIIVDPIVLFGSGEPGSDAPGRVILVRAAGGDYGFLADSIHEVIEVDRETVGPPPPFVEHAGRIRGVISRAEAEVLLLDADRLLQMAESSSDRSAG